MAYYNRKEAVCQQEDVSILADQDRAPNKRKVKKPGFFRTFFLTYGFETLLTAILVIGLIIAAFGAASTPDKDDSSGGNEETTLVFSIEHHFFLVMKV